MSEARPRVAVLGGGVAGLATAFDLEFHSGRSSGRPALTVFEAADECGGHLRTRSENGFLLERGPNGFLDSEPETLRLIERLELDDRLQKSEDATRRRFLLVGGRLRLLPLTPPAFLGSDLLPLSAKLRMAGELFVRRRRDLGRAAEDAKTDETVHEFGVRRLGRRFAETLLDPMVKGISGGDSRRLSLAAAFPRMVELEAEHGSLLKAMIRLQRQRRRSGPAADQGGAGGPAGTLRSFAGGMAELPRRLARRLEGEVLCGTAVERVERREDGFHVLATTDDGTTDHGPFAAVVDATPAHAAAGHQDDPELAALLGGIDYAPIVVVTLAFRRSDVAHALDGFGMLIPTAERRRLLGVLWSAAIFRGRAPRDRVLLRCMVGGAADPEAIEMDDDELVGLCLDELSGLFGLGAPPLHAWIFRHRRAIAQYEVGHLARLAAIGRRLDRQPGLFLTGSSYRGIAVNHCVADAARTARAVLDFLAPAAAPPRSPPETPVERGRDMA